MANTINKGFIKDISGNILLPITRAELLLDVDGKLALQSDKFLATTEHAGLMSAQEKAMLNGTGGQGFSDIYTKLEYLNQGLKFNGNPLKFYESAATPINITASDPISITVADNVVTFGLNSIIVTNEGSGKIITGVEVDTYGRVTKITKTSLVNEDFPNEISNKSLSGCTTENIADNANILSIVNKNYVDTKFNTLNNIVSGGLKFSGSIVNKDDAISVITNAANNVNKYYKSTAVFTLDKQYVHDSNQDVQIKTGDTLIVYKNSSNEIKFVHIPSGDEDVTLVGVRYKDNDTYEINPKTGQIDFIFDPNVINITSSGSNPVISIKQVSESSNGYLSSQDYVKFKEYSAKSISYTSEFTQGAGVYKIGTIKMGEVENIVYAKDTISTLTLENGIGSDVIYNPILKFVKTGENDLNIVLNGSNGIIIKKNNNTIEFSANNIVNTDSQKYLSIDDGYRFNIKKGSKNGESITNGITDYAEFDEFKTSVISIFSSMQPIIISNSLSETSGDYYYGSTKLKEAITLTI